MLEWFRKKFNLNSLPDSPDEESPANEKEGDIIDQGSGVFSTQFLSKIRSRAELHAAALARTFQLGPESVAVVSKSASDASEADVSGIKQSFNMSMMNMTDNQVAYFASQGFIGYQTMAMLSQNWLINKACKQPAKDAIRKGFDVATADGVEVPPEVLSYIDERDKFYGLTKNLVDFVYYGRMFGIRIAKFNVTSTDPEYYEKPFNPDGITPGSYRGITQIDPYWISPELSNLAATDPDSKHFYVPTWWRVGGQRIHRSHLIIFMGDEVPDVLKPTYRYGGVSVTQKIFERVYAAERTANEAPMLAQSKRETVIHVDVEKALANQAAFEDKMATWSYYRNNHGVKVVGPEETIEQFETSLADLDEVIMTQYQLVASIAGVPVTKLLGTVPKGFNSTGEYDEASYHEELESIQTHDLNRLIERHHLCVMRSDVAQKYPESAAFTPIVTWAPLDSMTAKEQAEVNLIKAQTGVALTQSGSIDGVDERQRIIDDKTSGYNGMAAIEDEDLTLNDDEIIN